MEENVTMMTVLTELRDFRAENNKRWEENDRRWEKNDRRWEENDKRWERNDKRLTAIELQTNKNTESISKLEEATSKNTESISKLEEATRKNTESISKLEEATRKNTESISKLEEATSKNTESINRLEKITEMNAIRIGKLEEGRVKDKRDLMEVLDTMQKSISNQFAEIKDYMDAKFAKIDVALTVNEIEHLEFKQLLKAYGIRLDLYNNRITNLERWNRGEAVGAY